MLNTPRLVFQPIIYQYKLWAYLVFIIMVFGTAFN